MENNFNKFRRAAFGGFNREDVISYIEKMKNEFFDYKKEVESTVEQLNGKIRELEAAYEAALVTVEVVTPDTFEEEEQVNPVSDINEATRKLRTVADELCKNLSDFMLRVTENSGVNSTAEAQDEIIPDEAVEELEIPAGKADRVSEILKATDSFSCISSIEENAASAEEDPKKEKRNILDVLGEMSFLK